MLVIAHRGANKEALENSWSAYQKSVECDSDRIELDVHLSLDRHIAINHDLDLSHTTGLNKNISLMTRKELETVKLLNGEPLPFLDEVLERYGKTISINIEIKGDSTELAEKVAQCVFEKKCADNVIISSFCYEPLVYLFENHPHLQRACLWGDSPRWPKLAFHSPLVTMQACRAKVFHPYTDWLTEEIMDQARARDWLVYPYVSMKGEDGDKVELWGWLRSLGIDGLCTNYPRQLRLWLSECEQESNVLSGEGR